MIFNKLIKKENDVIKLIGDSLENQKPVLLTYLNQHCFNIYNRDNGFRNLLDKKFNVFLDGYGVYATLRFLGYKDAEKFNATDLYRKLFHYFSQNQTRIFLVGGKFSGEFVFDKAKANKINIVAYQNGFFQEEEFQNLINKMKQSSPDVLIIGMGVPKQEFLAERISEFIKLPVLCVGGFLEFYFETKRRAPAVLRKSGLEWVHRLIKEPHRLWKRYLIGIPEFFFRIIRLRFSSDSK